MRRYLYLSVCFVFVFLQMKAQEKDFKGSWTTIETENKPIARHENGFVEVNGKFYLIGGRGVKPISIYDVKTNSWSSGKKTPIEIHHFQAVSYKSKIYIFGALSGKYPHETPLPNILIYDTKNDTWEEGAEVPENRRRGSAGVVVKKNKAYIVSGIIDGHYSGHVPWVDVYDFKTKTWEVLADAPRARDHFQAVIKDGKIYAAGGRNSSFATKQVFHLTIPEIDVYDIDTNTWTTLPKDKNIPTKRAGTSTVVLGDYIIVIGGESVAHKVAHNNVEAYHIKTNTWSSFKNMNRGRHGTQAILYKNKVYTVAGCGNRGGKPELDTIEVFEMSK